MSSTLLTTSQVEVFGVHRTAVDLGSFVSGGSYPNGVREDWFDRANKPLACAWIIHWAGRRGVHVRFSVQLCQVRGTDLIRNSCTLTPDL